MLKYRKLTDLTDEEIGFAINDIIHPESIGEIKRDYQRDQIDVDITTDWGGRWRAGTYYGYYKPGT